MLLDNIVLLIRAVKIEAYTKCLYLYALRGYMCMHLCLEGVERIYICVCMYMCVYVCMCMYVCVCMHI